MDPIDPIRKCHRTLVPQPSSEHENSHCLQNGQWCHFSPCKVSTWYHFSLHSGQMVPFLLAKWAMVPCLSELHKNTGHTQTTASPSRDVTHEALFSSSLYIWCPEVKRTALSAGNPLVCRTNKDMRLRLIAITSSHLRCFVLQGVVVVAVTLHSDVGRGKATGGGEKTTTRQSTAETKQKPIKLTRT